ncbi:MAG TPA: cysteine hydrolase family protein [Thermoanaerobaculia bacterium]|nr:cysteine hydrolase family protein [Thermoanaerobaculia bacterium]
MLTLPPNAALLIIDLQKAIDDPSWGVRNNPAAEDNIAALLSAWRSGGRPVVHVRHLSREPLSTYRPGQPGCDFKDVAQPAAGERVFDKSVHSAFIGTDLETWLRDRGINAIVMTGVITNNSVEATARHSSDLGFETIVVADATFTFGRRDYEGRERTADEVHAMSLANLDGEYARIATTAAILYSL